jgi:hypothetical protein
MHDGTIVTVRDAADAYTSISRQSTHAHATTRNVSERVRGFVEDVGGRGRREHARPGSCDVCAAARVRQRRSGGVKGEAHRLKRGGVE